MALSRHRSDLRREAGPCQRRKAEAPTGRGTPGTPGSVVPALGADRFLGSHDRPSEGRRHESFLRVDRAPTSANQSVGQSLNGGSKQLLPQATERQRTPLRPRASQSLRFGLLLVVDRSAGPGVVPQIVQTLSIRMRLPDALTTWRMCVSFEVRITASLRRAAPSTTETSTMSSSSA